MELVFSGSSTGYIVKLILLIDYNIKDACYNLWVKH